MRYIQKVFLGFCLLALFVGAAVAGLNPASPGLPASYGIVNNGKSSMCADCHTAVPSSATHRGSHFVWVPNVAALGNRAANTNTGGGWTSTNSYGNRNTHEYFRIGMWLGGSSGHLGTWSKYGGTGTDNNSYCTATAIDNAGFCTNDTTVANYNNRQIICESCHNIVKNVAGGNNLVAPMTSATYTANTGNAAQANDWANGTEATLCVGCHGFMYTTNAVNTETRYTDTRNYIDGAAPPYKENNHAHYMAGLKSRQNHHVGTGDTISNAKAAAGLLWRDLSVVPQDMDGVTVNTGITRGQMPMLGTWALDPPNSGVTAGQQKKKASTATDVNCLNCHAAPHTGDITLGASIIRDTTAGGDATDPLQRLGEGTPARAWMRFTDVNYCNDCHRTK